MEGFYLPFHHHSPLLVCRKSPRMELRCDTQGRITPAILSRLRPQLSYVRCQGGMVSRLR
eukprot:1287179-Rhodomonas_salina.1